MRIPTLRLELEGVREKLAYAFISRSDEINEMVRIGLDKAISAENLQEKINTEVQKAVDDAISSLSNNYTIRSIIIDIISKSLNSYNQ